MILLQFTTPFRSHENMLLRKMAYNKELTKQVYVRKYIQNRELVFALCREISDDETSMFPLCENIKETQLTKRESFNFRRLRSF